MKVSERFTWAVSVLNIKPKDLILEIGCGAGILAEQIANRLTTGSITAIDKSAPMINLACRRNCKFIETGKATFIVSDFIKAGMNTITFDTIRGFNVSLFWKHPTRELELIRNSFDKQARKKIFFLFTVIHN
jgi:2-polyprenyl-3-methyl-5-hydroxy-6-metoxy-1,4-benzoquinol methylase